MDFVALILFLALYYLRPQEWFAEFALLHPIQILSVLAIWAMVQKQNYKRLLQTPLDWLILTYFGWTLICGFTPRHTFSGIQSVILFYFVSVCSLDTIPRLKKFLGWWCLFVFIIAALAVATQFGFDPLNSNDLVSGTMKGRLVLNLSIFDNPNSLAHSIIPAIPLFYYLVYWRRFVAKAWILLLLVPLYCIYLTQSKGAFLCGFATVLATLAFGRSKPVQILILVVAIGFGYGALYALPRMNELQHSKTDPAIQGRIAAFTYGLQLMRTNMFGIGLGNFEGTFLRQGPVEKVDVIRVLPARHVPAGGNGQTKELDEQRIHVISYKHYGKATHCAYNQNGAELGYFGLFLFVGILYCCIRTLLLVKSMDDDEERIRRALFALVVAYAASSWMVDFCYRPTFFLMVAAVSAFHRHLLATHAAGQLTVAETPAPDRRPAWYRRIPPINLPGIPLPGIESAVPAGCLAADITPPRPFALQQAPHPGAAGSGRVLDWHKPDSSLASSLLKKFKWTQLGIMDYLIILALTYAATLYWQHLIATM